MINFPELTPGKITKRTSAGKTRSYPAALATQVCWNDFTQVHQIVRPPARGPFQVNPACSGRKFCCVAQTAAGTGLATGLLLRPGAKYVQAIPRGIHEPKKEAPDEVSSSARHQGQNDSRYRRLGADVSLPVPVRHRRPGAQPIREGDVLVLRRLALSRAAVSLRHHLGRSLVSGTVAVQQPYLHGAAGSGCRPPHDQRLSVHFTGAGQGSRGDRPPRAELHGARRLLLQELGCARSQVENQDGGHDTRTRGAADSAPRGHGRPRGGNRRHRRIEGLPSAEELR